MTDETVGPRLADSTMRGPSIAPVSQVKFLAPEPPAGDGGAFGAYDDDDADAAPGLPGRVRTVWGDPGAT